MHYSSSFLVLGGMPAAATVGEATMATATSSALPSTLPALVSQLSPCAIPCWNTVKTGIGCDAGNYSCLCELDGQLIVKMGICILNSDCQDKETSLIRSVCDVYKKSPPADGVASASSIITAAVGKVTATGSSKPTSTNTASPLGYGIEMALAAATAAIIL